MALLWPGFLVLLGLVPLLVALYVWQLRRRRRYAVRYSSLTLVREALGPQSRWRRHIPFALFLLALASLVLALTRPVSIIEVPSNQTAILLALDISGSMCATDIPPSRLAAAEEAARMFIRDQPDGTRIGIVAFAGFAQLIQPPTADRAALEAALDNLITARGTAIGSAILEAIDAIAEENLEVTSSVRQGATRGAAALPAGDYAPEIIVVLTDGVTTTGAPPLEAAQQAAERGIRIYTIGFGTDNPDGGGAASPPPPGNACFGRFGGGGWSGGGRFNRGIDEATLEQIAALTDGAYYAASSAGELQRVFQDLPLSYTMRAEITEISFGFAALGALLALIAVGMAIVRRPLL
jgi:Ca-activated chloride channel family protein